MEGDIDPGSGDVPMTVGDLDNTKHERDVSRNSGERHDGDTKNAGAPGGLAGFLSVRFMLPDGTEEQCRPWKFMSVRDVQGYASAYYGELLAAHPCHLLVVDERFGEWVALLDDWQLEGSRDVCVRLAHVHPAPRIEDDVSAHRAAQSRMTTPRSAAAGTVATPRTDTEVLEGSIALPDGSKYEGGLARGEKHGWGTFTWPDGSWFQGEWRNGRQHGDGLFVDTEGRAHEGTWRAGRPVLVRPTTATTPRRDTPTAGAANDDAKEAHVAVILSDGTQYAGGVRWVGTRQLAHGTGKAIYTDGGRFKGEFVDGWKHGSGLATLPSGLVYKGFWADGLPHGEGCCTVKDAPPLNGQWTCGVLQPPHKVKDGLDTLMVGSVFSAASLQITEEKNAKELSEENDNGQDTKRRNDRATRTGEITAKSGAVYTGEFYNERQGKKTTKVKHGWGHLAHGGTTYEGYWQNNRRHGFGIYTDSHGEYRGEWQEGRKHGKGVFHPALGPGVAQVWECGKLTKECAAVF